MNDIETLRREIVAIVEELRSTIQDIDQQDLQGTNVVSNARDRLRYIAALTEQAAGQTLNAAEAIADRTRAQTELAEQLIRRTRSPEIRAFLERLVAEHRISQAEVSEIIQAQSFQDLVGQVVNKLMTMIQHLEDNLVHLLVEDRQEVLAGPTTAASERVSQDEVDDLFD